jgi:C-terminal processing protease CtpA/Prc
MFGIGLRSAAAVAMVLMTAVAAQARPVYFGIGVVENRHRGAVQVVTVVEGGPAWEDGQLRPLDLITHINGCRIRTHAEMQSAVKRLPPGTTVRMDLEDRFGTRFSIEITPGAGGVIRYRATQVRPEPPREKSTVLKWITPPVRPVR